jgi:hypothetical protein
MFDAFSFSAAEISQITQCTFDRWQLRFGDNHLPGWSVVICYLVTAALCFAVQAKVSTGHLAMRLFWTALALMMVFLAINKQADLQALATAVARCIAKMQGWWEDRHGFRSRVRLGIGLVVFSVGLFSLWILRKDIKRNIGALTVLPSFLSSLWTGR